MSLMTLIFAPLLLSDNEHPMQKQHCRLLTDTMKSLSPAARTLKWAFCSHTSTFSFSVFTYIYYFDHFWYTPTPTPLSCFLGTFLFTLI